jgi:hypothetical protein
LNGDVRGSVVAGTEIEIAVDRDLLTIFLKLRANFQNYTGFNFLGFSETRVQFQKEYSLLEDGLNHSFTQIIRVNAVR